LLGNSASTTVIDGFSNLRKSVSRPDREAVIDEDLGVDEDTLDHMMARFGTSIGSLGLGGPIQGAPFMRRGSISTIHRARRQSIRPNMEGISVRPNTSLTEGDEDAEDAPQPRIPSSNPGRKMSSDAKIPPVNTDGLQESKRSSRYLGGVSEARFWAIFGSILLVYFVRLHRANLGGLVLTWCNRSRALTLL
jgi:hypothetical protein